MNLLRNISLALLTVLLAAAAFAGSAAKGSEPVLPASAAGQVSEKWIMEGEKRFRINCGRCHQLPHRFPPREMAMAVRHMRVRAMLTEDDMRYVIYYLTH
jgi:mono/diheme cytochrome c family protein